MGLVTGLNTGLTTGLSTGLNVGRGGGVSMLQDNGIYFPKTAADFSSLSLATPNHVWYCEDASGNATDEIGSLDLTATGTPSYQQTVAGFSTKVGFTITAASDGYFVDGTGINPGSSSFAVYGVVAMPAEVTGNTDIFRVTGATEKYRIGASGDKSQMLFNGGTTNITGDVGSDAHPFLMVLDHNASTVKIYNEINVGTGTHNAGPFTGQSALGAVSSFIGNDFQIAYACAWVGTSAEGMTEAVIEAFGWTLPY